MFPATITLHNAQQLNAVLNALHRLTAEGVQNLEAPARADGVQNVDPIPAPSKTAAASTPAAASAATPPPPSTAATEPVTYKQVSAAIVDGVKRDRQRVLDTLKRFGVTKGPELKPEQYAAFIAALAEEPVAA